MFRSINKWLFLVPMFLAAAGLRAQQATQTAEGESSCVTCHLEMGDDLAEPVEGMKQDVHDSQGLSCHDCHGGDPTVGFDGDTEASMDPAKGYIGVPKRTEIPQFCARCHSDPDYMRRYNPRVSTDQLSEYKTSVHGRLLSTGDTKVATCIDCHGVHGIRQANDARSSVYPLNIPATCGRCHADADYMQDYAISTDQNQDYAQSVHGMALLERGDQAAPACNDCHGNHGASPPGAPSVAFVCGQCHLNNSELFLKSPHRAAFQELELPECETCHSNHLIQHPTDEMLGAGEQSICLDCHDEGSAGLETAAFMKGQIDSLKTDIHLADSLVARAERAGMQVSEAKFSLNDADDALVKSRTLIHSFSTAEISEVIAQGRELTEKAITIGHSALDELQFRRKGLAISLVVILILAAGIYLKIREIDKKYPLHNL